MNKKIQAGLAGAAMLGAILVFAVIARSGSLQGPVIHTNADVTCPQATGTATPGLLLAQSTPATNNGAGVTNQICVEVDWVSGSSLRIGDSSIGTSQGIPLAASTGSSETFCGDAAVYCYGIGGTAVAAVNQVNRQ